jgi:hypothetical protein
VSYYYALLVLPVRCVIAFFAEGYILFGLVLISSDSHKAVAPAIEVKQRSVSTLLHSFTSSPTQISFSTLWSPPPRRSALVDSL